jgi:general stress protein 26
MQNQSNGSKMYHCQNERSFLNITQRTTQVLVNTFLLLCVSSFTHSLYGQSKQPTQLDRENLIATAREIMKTARYCALITLDSGGRPHARAMDPFPPDEQMIVWLGTNPKSRKVAEIRLNHRVTLYYFDREDQAYVTISGLARIVQDPQEKARHWKEEWQNFYPDRERGYLLIAVTPEKLEVINQKKGIIGNSITWTPPAVRFTNHKPK